MRPSAEIFSESWSFPCTCCDWPQFSSRAFLQAPSLSVRVETVGFRGSETQSGCLSPDIGAGDSSPAPLLFSFGTLEWPHLLVSNEEEIKIYRALCKP